MTLDQAERKAEPPPTGALTVIYRLERELSLHDVPQGWKEIARGTLEEINQAYTDDLKTPAGYGYAHRILDEAGNELPLADTLASIYA